MPLNDKHPELKEGEMFLTNIYWPFPPHLTPRESRDCMERYEKQFKSFRMGEIAYDRYGEPIPHVAPIFVSREEYESKRT